MGPSFWQFAGACFGIGLGLAFFAALVAWLVAAVRNFVVPERRAPIDADGNLIGSYRPKGQGVFSEVHVTPGAKREPWIKSWGGLTKVLWLLFGLPILLGLFWRPVERFFYHLTWGG